MRDENIKNPDFALNCPLPINNYEKVLLAHGSGGTLSHQLIQKMFLSQFNNSYLNNEHDGAVLNIGNSKVAFTTDSYVVQPIFFPGGNIGDLAVNGTINDLAMCGAKPQFISCGLIIEEGFPMNELWEIILSMQQAAKKANVQIVTGDTKVVEKGKGDKIFINTSGIGIVPSEININPKNCKPGDLILLNGRIAEHGIAIMSARENLTFETTIESDTNALNTLVEDMFSVSNNIHVLRDPTRGGIASVLNEIAEKANVGITIFEKDIPIREEVNSACELLGLDPLYIANEGKLLAFVSPEDADKILNKMKKNPLGREACIIGKVTAENSRTVILKTSIGTNRIVDMLSGEQLPRIC